MNSFSFNPKDANPILDQGEYGAMIIDGKVGVSKNGADKIEVTIKAYGPNNKSPQVTDHLVSPFGISRLKQICDATGFSEDFETGNVDPTKFIGKNLRVRLHVRKDDTGQYEDQNVIRKYLPDTTSSQLKVPKPDSDAKERPIDETAAYAGYVAAVKKDHPDVSDELLKKNFVEARNSLVRDKTISEFTDADWTKVCDEGPQEFVPF